MDSSSAQSPKATSPSLAAALAPVLNAEAAAAAGILPASHWADQPVSSTVPVTENSTNPVFHLFAAP